MAFVRRIRNFARRELFVQVWVVPVWLGLGLASLVILLVPFRRIAPLLGTMQTPGQTAMEVTAEGIDRARKIKRTIDLAARFAPWRADCYPQAIIARMLLKTYRLPYRLSIGVARAHEGEGMNAHAWVACGPIPVSGGRSDDLYTVVTQFTG
ncbi:MAG: lasso peptide biosynthesis B2 protein [Novosphingobium sp.]|nr:lasso peptide biosynthesis B2 protein [Novosphingobium sp.]